MSIDRRLYLGPYVECTYRKTTRTVYRVGCTNSQCGQYPRSQGPDAKYNFCRFCASPVGDVPIRVEDRPSPYDIVDDELTPLCGEGSNEKDRLYLGINGPRPGNPRREEEKINEREEFHLSIEDVSPLTEMAWFSTAYAEEIEKLEEVYDHVTVKWGLHQYFM
jgi:hypothetical protein